MFSQRSGPAKTFFAQKSGSARTAPKALHVGLKVIKNEQQNKLKIEILNLNKTSKTKTSEIIDKA